MQRSSIQTKWCKHIWQRRCTASKNSGATATQAGWSAAVSGTGAEGATAAAAVGRLQVKTGPVELYQEQHAN
jgi:hypothetical protein